MKAQTGSRSLSLILNLGSRWESVVNATLPPLYHRATDLVPIVRETQWAQKPVRMGAKR